MVVVVGGGGCCGQRPGQVSFISLIVRGSMKLKLELANKLTGSTTGWVILVIKMSMSSINASEFAKESKSDIIIY